MTDTAPLFSICIFDRQNPFLKETVNSVYQELAQLEPAEVELMVLTDGTDLSLALTDIEKEHPGLKIVVLPPRTDRLRAFNYAIRKTSGTFLCLFNSGVELAPGFFKGLKKYQDKLNLFSLSPSLTIKKNIPGSAEYTHFPTRTVFEDEYYTVGMPEISGQPAPTLFSWAGMSIYRRNVLTSLNGFDTGYGFFKWKWCGDLDICFRAWQEGYGSLVDPELKVFMLEGAGWDDILPAPRFYRYADVISKISWNVNRFYFIFRNRLPFAFFKFLGSSLAKFDVLIILTACLGFIKKVFRGSRELEAKPVFNIVKIREITSRETL